MIFLFLQGIWIGPDIAALDQYSFLYSVYSIPHAQPVFLQPLAVKSEHFTNIQFSP